MQLCSVIVVWNCGDCCNHALGLQHSKLLVAAKSLQELKFCPFHFKRFPSFLCPRCARLLLQTVFWTFFLQGKSTRKESKQTPSCTTCCPSTGGGTLQSLCVGVVCSSFPCPYQWWCAGGVGGIIGLFSLMWQVLSQVGKRSSELICILRLQTNQWLLSKGMICSGSSLAILIPQLHTFVPFLPEVSVYSPWTLAKLLGCWWLHLAFLLPADILFISLCSKNSRIMSRNRST